MKIPLHAGFYESRGLIANAQTCRNLYPEPNPKDSPFPTTLYPTPGLRLWADLTGSFTGWVRGLYWASNGELYGVAGPDVFRLDPITQIGNFVGNLGSDSGSPVSMVDNTQVLLIVDGTTNGWTVDLVTNALTPVNDQAFYGATRVDYIDTFFVLNRPGTQYFYLSPPLWNGTDAFNPLYFASKAGYNDLLMSIAALHDNIWLLGEQTTEVWYNSGATDFPFQRMPNSIIQQGCIAPYSVVIADNAVYWLSEDRTGRSILMRGEGYTAKRVSTFAVEDIWSKYQVAQDVIGMAHQDGGHLFIVLTWIFEDETWVYDATTGMWHQRASMKQGAQGQFSWMASAVAYWNSEAVTGYTVVAGSRYDAKIFALTRDVSTDDGLPITRVRAFPHILNDQKRMVHSQFVAAMQGTNLAPDQISLRWSDDGGQTFGTPVVQTTNNASMGQYSWRRLGMARDRVYEISWTAQGETALNGAWLEGVPAET